MGNRKKHSRIYNRMLDHNEDRQIGREWTRERKLRLREKQEHNDAIQPIVQDDIGNLFVPLPNLFICYWSIWIVINCAISIILKISLNYQIICRNVHVNLYVHHKKLKICWVALLHILHMYYHLGKTTCILTKKRKFSKL